MSARFDLYARGELEIGPRRLPQVWAIRQAGTPPVELGEGSVGDVEALVQGVVRSRSDALRLTPDDELELTSHLFELTVRFTGLFEPRPGILFRPWLFDLLRRRTIDWAEKFYGRNGEKRLPGFDDAGDDEIVEAAPQAVEDEPFAAAELEAFLDRPDWQSALVDALREHRGLLERDRRRVAA